LNFSKDLAYIQPLLLNKMVPFFKRKVPESLLILTKVHLVVKVSVNDECSNPRIWAKNLSELALMHMKVCLS